MKWITSQIGAREHYAIPRVLYRAGKLDRLYTDFWASAAWRIFGKLTGKSSLATRFHPDLKGASVTAFNFQALKASRQRFTNPYDGFLKVGEAFGRDVDKDLEKLARVESRAQETLLIPKPSTLVSRPSTRALYSSATTPDSWSLPDG